MAEQKFCQPYHVVIRTVLLILIAEPCLQLLHGRPDLPLGLAAGLNIQNIVKFLPGVAPTPPVKPVGQLIRYLQSNVQSHIPIYIDQSHEQLMYKFSHQLSLPVLYRIQDRIP